MPKTGTKDATEPLLHYPDVARTSLPPGATAAATSSSASPSNSAQKSTPSVNGAASLNGNVSAGTAGAGNGSRGAATEQQKAKGPAGIKGSGNGKEAALWEKPSQLQEWEDDTGAAKPGLAGDMSN